MNYNVGKLTRAFELPAEQPSPANVEHLIAIGRRQWATVAATIMAALVVGACYLAIATPRYTASTSILIDISNQKIADQLSAGISTLDDEVSVLSQVELLRSKRIALLVNDALDLPLDRIFAADRQGGLQNLIAAIGSRLGMWNGSATSTAPGKTEQSQRDIVEQLQRNLSVSRVGRTYVLELSYTSGSTALAARIAGAYAEAYLADQLGSKYEANRRASDWLQQRIAELRRKSLEADRAIQTFRAQNGLITTDGQLVSDQKLAQVNGQLVAAQTDIASAQAKYNRIQSIIDSGQMQSAVTDSLESSIIGTLQAKYLEASRRNAEISGRLGPQHAQAMRLRGEMAEYRRLMFEELGRIAQSYKNTYDVALARQKSLEAQAARATGISTTANDAQVQLRELERESDTYKKLYETFLQRYQQSMQQQSFPVTEARVISTPTIPDKASSPKKPLVVTLSVLLGLIAGIGLGAFREFRDRYFRVGDQIRDILDLEPLGTVPLCKGTGVSVRTPPAVVRHKRVIAKDDFLANFVVDHPLSGFAETMRSAKIAIDVKVGPKTPRLIGIVSVLPGEGKSTIAINFAELLASQGGRVLLIDADLRNPGATRQLGPNAECGILEALQGDMPVRDILMVNPYTKLAFLPAVIKRRIANSAALLASEAMDRLIRDVSDTFDYIIIDLPPLAPVVDARALSTRLDACLLVVEWGKTARAVVRKTLMENGVLADKCAGVILNKVDGNRMKYYQNHGSSEFYYSRYSSYHRD